MLDRARMRVAEIDTDINLQLGDVQELNFPDNSFDDAIATFVFCSVPDPVLGFNEIARMLKPNGCLLLLEHVRSANPVVGTLMDLFDPIGARLMGPHINRRTVENIQQS
jgi:ubiquinone/menaquinone biosynthesis C-methylase UbiE